MNGYKTPTGKGPCMPKGMPAPAKSPAKNSMKGIPLDPSIKSVRPTNKKNLGPLKGK